MRGLRLAKNLKFALMGHDPVLCPDVRIDVSAQGGFVQVVSERGVADS